MYRKLSEPEPQRPHRAPMTDAARVRGLLRLAYAQLAVLAVLTVARPPWWAHNVFAVAVSLSWAAYARAVAR